LPLTFLDGATTNLATSLAASLTRTSLPMNGVPYASLVALMFLTYKTLHNSKHMDGMAKRREKTHTHQQLIRQRCGGVRIAAAAKSPHKLLRQ